MKKPFENTTNSPIYVAGVMIPPGEVYLLEVPDAPADGATQATALTLAEEVALLLLGNVATVVAGLGDLSSDALTMMAALENQAAKPRKSLLTAIADAKIALADAKLTSDDLSDEADKAAQQAAEKSAE